MIFMISCLVLVALVDHLYAKYRKNPFATWG